MAKTTQTTRRQEPQILTDLRQASARVDASDGALSTTLAAYVATASIARQLLRQIDAGRVQITELRPTRRRK